MSDDIKIIKVSAAILILGSVTVLVGVMASALKQTAIVEIGGKEVFRGSGLCVSVRSAGASTSVDISPPCEFPGRSFTDKDVKVTIQ